MSHSTSRFLVLAVLTLVLSAPNLTAQSSLTAAPSLGPPRAAPGAAPTPLLSHDEWRDAREAWWSLQTAEMPESVLRVEAGSQGRAVADLPTFTIPSFGHAMRTGLTGAVIGALFGGYIEAFIDPHGEALDLWPVELAIPGFVGGVVSSFFE